MPFRTISRHIFILKFLLSFFSPCFAGLIAVLTLKSIFIIEQGKQSISLEPGGQFELSGAPLETLHQTCAEVNSHLYQVCHNFKSEQIRLILLNKLHVSSCNLLLKIIFLFSLSV